jgi:hypothetical protein
MLIQNKVSLIYLRSRPSGQKPMETGNKPDNFTFRAETISKQLIFILRKISFKDWSKFVGSLIKKVTRIY